MKLFAINSYNKSRLFLFGMILCGIAAITSCKKKEECNSMENMKMENTPLPPIKSAVYVANEYDGTISVLDPQQDKNICTIHLSEDMSLMLMPHNVQVAPDGKTVWVTAMTEATWAMEQVIVIEQATNKILKRIEAGTSQHLTHVVLDSASVYAYVVCNTSNQVIQINAKTFEEVKRFELGADHKPHGMRYFRGKLYIANMGANSLSILTIADGSIQEIPLNGVAVQTAISPDGNFVFVSLYDTKKVVKYNIQSGLLTFVSLPEDAKGPVQLYPTPDSKQIYICDQGVLGGNQASNKVYVLDVEKEIIINSITVGNAAHGVVLSKDGKRAYVTNVLSNSVSVIDVNTQTVINTIAVGKSPNGISFWSDLGGMP